MVGGRQGERATDLREEIKILIGISREAVVTASAKLRDRRSVPPAANRLSEIPVHCCLQATPSERGKRNSDLKRQERQCVGEYECVTSKLLRDD